MVCGIERISQCHYKGTHTHTHTHTHTLSYVSLLSQGKGVVCTLHEGDDFGKLSLLTAGERSASIRTREPNSYFLQIERDDFRRILMSVEHSTMKITHRGQEVMHLQRESAGRLVTSVLVA